MSKMFTLFCACFLGGCAMSVPHPTGMTLSPSAMEIVGPAKGESKSTRAFCFVPLDETASLAAATQSALESESADAIVNPMVDDERGIGFLGLWCWQKIKIYGTAVRFKQSGAAQTAAGGAKNYPGDESRSETELVSDIEKRLWKKRR
jgi:hypothetical protein